MNRPRTSARQRRWGLALAAVLTLVCSAFLVSPASADGFGDCATAKLCLYSAPAGGGDRKDVTADAQAYTDGWDGRTLSAKNNTASWACFYVEGAYGGLVQTLRPGASGEYATDPRFAGTISSHKLVPSFAHCFTGYERCPDNRVCTFAEPNGRGAMTVHLPSLHATAVATVTNYGTSYGAGTPSASVVNRTERHVCFYPQTDFTGTWTEGETRYGAYVVLRGDGTTVPGPFAGTFRSHELVRSTQECQ